MTLLVSLSSRRHPACFNRSGYDRTVAVNGYGLLSKLERHSRSVGHWTVRI